MSGIDLDITDQGDGQKTHTMFRMKWYETITFHNWERRTFTVTIQGGDGEGPVLEEGDSSRRDNSAIPGKQQGLQDSGELYRDVLQVYGQDSGGRDCRGSHCHHREMSFRSAIMQQSAAARAYAMVIGPAPPGTA